MIQERRSSVRGTLRLHISGVGLFRQARIVLDNASADGLMPRHWLQAPGRDAIPLTGAERAFPYGKRQTSAFAGTGA
jgi:hypothetical protein